MVEEVISPVEKEFLIYVNAITAQEEKVLILMETPGGTLTM